MNGRLPASALAPIRGGRLRKDAARAWLAMDAESVRRGWGHLEVVDSYRPLGAPGDLNAGRWSQWAAWERYQRGGNLAARPGTSNHGWGLAVDVSLRTRWIIDQIGAKYGWAKKWSDAPSEWWHFRFKEGIYKPPPPNPLGFLTKEEQAKVREYRRLKKLGTNKARRGQLWRWFIRRRKDIYRVAQKGGWDKANRRRRYRFFVNLTKG